jgi:hypothetical protein
MHRRFLIASTLVLAGLLAACGTARPASSGQVAAPQQAEAGFAALIETLSEPGGYFPSENLVSNETSYQHILGKLRERSVTGGVYVGVGPDQNFTYIAQIRPEVAFIIDIRRDNLLHHLMYKALFEQARNRIEYFCLLFGRPLPADPKRWEQADITELVNYVDSVPPQPALYEAAVARVRAAVQRTGYPLSEEDLHQIHYVHSMFFQAGLDLRYSFRGEFPTYRRLLLEKDQDGVQRNYLASEEAFQFIKAMQHRNRIIPVVGDLAGPHALRAIGREVTARGLRITAFYTSNVEQYLMQGTAFNTFATTVADLPLAENGMIIRSYFNRYGFHPNNQSGHNSTQLLEPFAAFVREQRAGGYADYYDLVTKNILPARRSI